MISISLAATTIQSTLKTAPRPHPSSLPPSSSSSSSHQQQMTTSSLSSPSSLELELWKNICRATAYYQRAQQQLTLSSNYEYTDGGVEDNTNNTVTSSMPQSINNDDVGGVKQNQRVVAAAIKDAECAYKLYRSCHKHVMTISTTCRLSSTSSPGSVMILPEDGITNDAIPHPSCGTQTTATTINLELRLAQTLRLLATLHASSSNSDDVKNSSNNLEMAINYHDRAVSLLVGVFEEEEERITWRKWGIQPRRKMRW